MTPVNGASNTTARLNSSGSSAILAVMRLEEVDDSTLVWWMEVLGTDLRC
jgi:hypothetical protein